MFQKVIRGLFRMVGTPFRPFLAVVHWSADDYRALAPRAKNDTWIVAAVLIAAAVVGAVFTFEIFTYCFWKVRGSANAAEIVRNLGLLAAAIVGLIFAIWRTMIAQRGSYLTEQGQITDRYAKAVELLAADKAQTRIGAIYALKRIAQDSPERDLPPVADLLSEFVRDPPYQKEQAERRNILEDIDMDRRGRDDAPPPVRCPDIIAALIALNEIVGGATARLVGHHLDLNRARLNDLALINAVFDGANLFSADLTGADLTFVEMSGANLSGADLEGAKLLGANLSGAILSGAKNLRQEQIDLVRPTPPPTMLSLGIFWPYEERNGDWLFPEET